MRNTLPLFFFALLCTGCAYEGTVVRKDFRPLAASASLGIDAIYRFELRDRAGNIHSQMVPENVFASYKVGDYFDAWQKPADRVWSPNGEQPLLIQRPLEEFRTHYRPVGTLEPEPSDWR